MSPYLFSQSKCITEVAANLKMSFFQYHPNYFCLSCNKFVNSKASRVHFVYTCFLVQLQSADMIAVQDLLYSKESTRIFSFLPPSMLHKLSDGGLSDKCTDSPEARCSYTQSMDVYEDPDQDLDL